MNQRVRIALGLGSNLGDRLGVLREAVRRLRDDFLTEVTCSSVFESPPWGITEQPDFLNLVLVGESEWKPPAIVNYVKFLERELGREPAPRYGPRLIDIDLLAYDDKTWDSEGVVVVPHPRLSEREFVLFPLREAWPGWTHPVLHKTIEQLCREFEETQPRKARVIDPSP